MRVGIFVLLQNLVGRFHLFTTDYYVGCGFVINGFYHLDTCSLYTHFGESFYHKWMLNFIKCFFCVYWDFVLSFLNMVHHINRFVYVEPLLWPWNKSYFLYAVGSSLLIFFEEFFIYIHQRYWPVILFFCSDFVWFWYQGDGGFIEWLWECSLLFSLLEEFEKDRYKFFVCLVEFPREAVQSWTLFAGSFVLFFFLNCRFYFTSSVSLFKLSVFFLK